MSLLKSVPIKFALNDEAVLQQVRQLIGRDKRITNLYLQIIHANYDRITITKPNGKKVMQSKLVDKLTLTTRDRTTVEYDLKKKYNRISHNEMLECRDYALALYKAYRTNYDKHEHPTLPHIRKSTSRIILKRRFELDYHASSLVIHHGLFSEPRRRKEGKVTTKLDTLKIKLVISQKVQERLAMGIPKAVILTRKADGYYANIQLACAATNNTKPRKELRVGIDLGIAVNAALVAIDKQDKVVYNQMYKLEHHRQNLNRLQERISELQQQSMQRDLLSYLQNILHHIQFIQSHHYNHKLQQLDNALYTLYRDYSNSVPLSKLQQSINVIGKSIPYQLSRLEDLKPSGTSKKDRQIRYHINWLLNQLPQLINYNCKTINQTEGTFKVLRRLRHARQNLTTDIDNQLVNRMFLDLQQLSASYQLKVYIGNPKGIRYRQRHGSGNRQLRKKVNSWRFYSFSNKLEQKLNSIGVKLYRINESYTSKRCHKCQKRGSRNRQSYFICNACHIKCNADFNGAYNIAQKLTLIASKREQKAISSKGHKKGIDAKAPKTTSHRKTVTGIPSTKRGPVKQKTLLEFCE